MPRCCRSPVWSKRPPGWTDACRPRRELLPRPPRVMILGRSTRSRGATRSRGPKAAELKGPMDQSRSPARGRLPHAPPPRLHSPPDSNAYRHIAGRPREGPRNPKRRRLPPDGLRRNHPWARARRPRSRPLRDRGSGAAALWGGPRIPGEPQATGTSAPSGRLGWWLHGPRWPYAWRPNTGPPRQG